MRSPDHLKPKGFSLNMTPMIDVVFLLIIFFLVSSNLIRQDVSMELDLPSARTVEPVPETETRKVTLNVPRPGTVLIGTQPADRTRLGDHLRQQRQIGGKDTELRIRTNKDVPYGDIEPLLVLAARCGIWNVSFSVVEKEPE